jgi:hypothetical protein
MPDEIVGQGRSFAQLGNAVSDAIVAALRRGMDSDDAACVVVQVAADYARGTYGNAYLAQLAAVVLRRGDMLMPLTTETEETE